MVRFTIGVTAMAILLWGATQLFALNRWMNGVPSFSVEILLLLSVGTVTVFYFLQKVKANHPLDFVKNFLLSVVLKILLSGVFIFILMRLDSARASINAVFFLISYLFFTSYEVLVLTKKKNRE